jgi:protein-S-isoprenylcysteine O-methyltransferase Ste14
MRAGRAYFALQAIAGAVWWVAVLASPLVRTATLGRLDPAVMAAFDVPLFVIGSALAACGVRAAAWLSTGWTVLVAVALALYATVVTEAGWGVVAMAAAAVGSVLALSIVVLGRVPVAWISRGPFVFRPAALRRSAAIPLLATLAQILVFWGLFLVLIPSVIAALERRWRIAASFPDFTWPLGLAVLVLASALGLWSAFVMSTRGRGTPLPAAMPNLLVIAGPYRCVRNPMAVASIVQGVAVGLLLSSWLVVAYAIAGALLWNYAVRPGEETDLERRFGSRFAEYRVAVRCWIPRTPWSPP